MCHVDHLLLAYVCMQFQRVPFLGQESQHVIVSWKEGIYKVGVVRGEKDCQEVYIVLCVCVCVCVLHHLQLH